MTKLQCDNLILDTKTGECICNKKKVIFKKDDKDFRLLEYLMRNKNRPLKYEKLLLALEDNPIRRKLIVSNPELYKKAKFNLHYVVRNLKNKLKGFDKSNFRCRDKKGYRLFCKK